MAESDYNLIVGLELNKTSVDKIGAEAGRRIAQNVNKEFSGALRLRTDQQQLALGRITGKATEFEKSMAAANARVIAFGASVAPIFAVRAAFDKLVSSTIEVEKSITDVNAIFELSQNRLREFTVQLFNVANKTGQTFENTAKAAAEFARQGLTVEETLKRTSSALALSRISGLGMGDAVTSITAILNSFSREALNTADIVNRLTQVDTNYAVSSGGLAEALKRVGSSAEDANVSLNQTIALITAAAQITGRSGTVIGNAFKTIFTRLQRPEVLTQLEQAGIEVRNLNGENLNTITILNNLANSYNNLSQSQKSSVAESVGSVYQINILKAIIKDLTSNTSIFAGAQKVAADSTGAVDRRLKSLNNTISSQLIRSMNDITSLASNFGEALFGDSLRNGIKDFDDFAKKFNEKSNPQQKDFKSQFLQGSLKAVGNWLAGPGLQVTIGLIFKLLEELGKFTIKSGQDILGLDKATKEKAVLEESYLQVLRQEPELLKAVYNGEISILEVSKQRVAETNKLINQLNISKSLASGLASASLGKVNLTNPKASGFIPNLSPIQRESELARQGGYIAGRVISTTINNGAGSLTAIANSKETKSTIISNGKKYDFINPPFGSVAGKRHEQEALRRTGVNPYSLRQIQFGSGFIPDIFLNEIAKSINAQKFLNHKGNNIILPPEQINLKKELAKYDGKKIILPNINLNNLKGRANGFVPEINHPDYKDYSKWQAIMQKEMEAERYDSEEFKNAWKESEKVKNRPSSAKGFIPNLYDPIVDALNRENRATGGHATLASDSLLISPSNPYGLAAIDSRNQSSAREAIQQHKTSGQTLTQIKKAHTATGFIPNLAETNDLISSTLLFGFGSQASSVGSSRGWMDRWIKTFPILFSENEKEIFAKRKLTKEFDNLYNSLLSGEKGIKAFGTSFNSLKDLDVFKNKNKFSGRNESIQSTLNGFQEDIENFDNKTRVNSQRISSSGWKLTNASIITGAIASQVGGNISPTFGAGINNLQTGIIQAGQSLIAFPNKIGKALSVGLVTSGVVSALDTWSRKLEDIQKQFEIQQDKIQKLNENFGVLTSTINNLDNMYLNSENSTEDIVNQNKIYAETIAKINQLQGSSGFANKLLLAPDAAAKISIINRESQKQNKNLNLDASLLNAQEFFAKKTFNLPIIGNVGNYFGAKGNGYFYSNEFQKDEAKNLLVENASSLVSVMSEDFTNELSKNVESLSNFRNILSTFKGEDAEKIRGALKTIKDAGGETALNQVVSSIRALITQGSLNNNPEILKIRNAGINELTKKNEDLDISIKREQYLKRFLSNQGALAAGNYLDVQQISNRKAYNTASLNILQKENEANLFSSQHGEITTAGYSYNIQRQKIAIETQNQISELRNQTNRNLVESFTQSIDSFLNKDLKSNVLGEKGVETGKFTEDLIRSINGGLTKTIAESKGDLFGRFSSNGSFNIQAFSKRVSELGTNNSELQNRIFKYLNSQESIELLKSLNESNKKEVEISESARVQNKEANIKYLTALKEIDFKQKTSYLGGIQGFLNRDVRRGLSREIIRDATILGRGTGSDLAKSEAAFRLLDTLNKSGIKIDSNNPLIKKAFDVAQSSGTNVLNKEANRILNSVSRSIGDNNLVSQGLKNLLYSPNRTSQAVSAILSTQKPESNDLKNIYESQSDSSRLFTESLSNAEAKINNFSNTISKSTENLKNIFQETEKLRNQRDLTEKKYNQKIDEISNKENLKYNNAAEFPEVQKGTNFFGEFPKIIGGLTSILAGAALFTSFRGNSSGIKNIEQISKNIEKIAEEIKISRGISNAEKSTIAASNIIQKGSSLSNSGNKLSKTGTSIISETEDIAQKVIKKSAKERIDTLLKNINLEREVLNEKGLAAGEKTESIRKSIISFRENIIKKAVQDLKLGRTTGIASIDTKVAGDFRQVNPEDIKNLLNRTINTSELPGGPSLLNRFKKAKIAEESIFNRDKILSDRYNKIIEGRNNSSLRYAQANALEREVKGVYLSNLPSLGLNKNFKEFTTREKIANEIGSSNFGKNIKGAILEGLGLGGKSLKELSFLGKALKIGGGTLGIAGAALGAVDVASNLKRGQYGEASKSAGSSALFAINPVLGFLNDKSQQTIDASNEALQSNIEEEGSVKTSVFRDRLLKQRIAALRNKGYNNLSTEEYQQLVGLSNRLQSNVGNYTSATHKRFSATEFQAPQIIKNAEDFISQKRQEEFTNKTKGWDSAQGSVFNSLTGLRASSGLVSKYFDLNKGQLTKEELGNLPGVYKAIYGKSGSKSDLTKFVSSLNTTEGYNFAENKLTQYFSKFKPTVLQGSSNNDTNEIKELVKQVSLAQGLKNSQDSQALIDKLEAIREILNKANEKGKNESNNNTQETVEFNPLQVNVNITSDDEGKKIVSYDEFAELKRKVDNLINPNYPSKV